MTADLISVVLPVFGLIVVGFAASWAGLLSPRAGEGLSDFVSNISVPALVFRTMAGSALPQTQPWGYWLAYFCGLALVWATAMALARGVFRVSFGESVVAGFAAAQSNTVLVGIPVIFRAYGEAGAVPLFLLIAVHLPITMTTATLLYEGAENFSGGVLARRLLLNPLILSIAAGLAWRFCGLPYGGAAKSIVESLAAAAIPCALVAMGLALRRYGMQAEPRLTLTISALKLLAHPAAVFILAFKVFSMPPVWAGVAVLFAAMPCGINAYLFADRYKTGVATASSAIAVSTGLSVLSVLFWLWMLGVGAP
jgi:malonate transporter and related proteins